MTETDIAGVVVEVRDHAAASSETPESEFGTAEEYAARFPVSTKKRRRSTGARLTAVTTILAVAYVAAMLALKGLLDVDIRDIVGPVSLWPAAAIIATGSIAGFLIDYLRPTPRTAQQ